MATEVRGISTYKTYLMVKKTSQGAYEKLIDITAFPDLIPPNDRIDITTLSDRMRVYIQGIGDTSELTFNANYTPDNYQAVNALDNDEQYECAVWFGTDANGDPSGSYGQFAWTGTISAGVSGGGVNEAVGMTITCTPSTEIVPTFPPQ